METNDPIPTTISILIGFLAQMSVVGLIVFLLIRRFGNVARVQNKNITDITDEKKLAKLAMTSSLISVAELVAEKVNDPILLEKLARGASDPKVRVAAFEKAFSQLADDKALCYQIVDSMGLRHSAAYDDAHFRYSGIDPELLLMIAARHPDIIRQFWPKIERVYHEDKRVHYDDPACPSDCTHPHADSYSHKDISDHEALQRFPPAAKGSAALDDVGR